MKSDMRKFITILHFAASVITGFSIAEGEYMSALSWFFAILVLTCVLLTQCDVEALKKKQ